MAKFRITGPDGVTYDVTAPEGASEADIMGFVQSQTAVRQAPEQQSGVRHVDIPSQPNPIGMGEGIARAALQGVTFGGGDELAAGLKAAVNPSNFSEVYDQTLERARSRADQFREESPVTATVAEIGGALPTAFVPLGALGKAAQGGTAATRALAGGAIGTGQGATYAFNAGEGGLESRASDALTGAVLGGGLGAAAPVIGGVVRRGAQGLANSRATRGVVQNAPDVAELARRSSSLFKQADDLGVVVRPESYRQFAEDIGNLAVKEGVDAQVTPATSGVLARVMSEAQTGKPLSLQQLNTVRAVAQNAAGSTNPNERRIAALMIDKIDDFVADLTPEQMIGDAKGPAGPMLREARDLWGRMRRTQMLDEAVELAGDSAGSAGTGGNRNNAVRQRLRSILASPTKRRGFSEPEIKAMREVVRGTPTQNALRLLGRLSPETGALSLYSNIIAAPATSGLSVPLTAGGWAAKRLADRGTRSSTDIVRALVASGGRLPPATIRPQSGRLAELLAQRNAAVTGPARSR